ncbi:MAG: hypothetical protein J7L73_00065 [Anaerolineales bacterium]|nr:hypothetical protein [Anaerolineales bacterium]
MVAYICVGLVSLERLFWSTAMGYVDQSICAHGNNKTSQEYTSNDDNEDHLMDG